mmetsp:Transcript_26391/g.91784  ORF Transcript_26391/g.91784 Transcript_26391/m.91784 type:complete len:200 (-) Transcript_26391:903-1502(-)
MSATVTRSNSTTKSSTPAAMAAASAASPARLSVPVAGLPVGLRSGLMDVFSAPFQQRMPIHTTDAADRSRTLRHSSVRRRWQLLLLLSAAIAGCAASAAAAPPDATASMAIALAMLRFGVIHAGRCSPAAPRSVRPRKQRYTAKMSVASTMTKARASHARSTAVMLASPSSASFVAAATVAYAWKPMSHATDFSTSVST